MKDSRPLMLGFAIVMPLSLAITALLEHPSASHPVKPVLAYEEPDYPVELQQRLMEQLELADKPRKVKMYHPKTETARAKAIADVWSLDTKKDFQIAKTN